MSVATASSLTRASSPSSISPASAVFSCEIGESVLPPPAPAASPDPPPHISSPALWKEQQASQVCVGSWGFWRQTQRLTPRHEKYAMVLASLMGLGEHPARRVAVVDCRDDDAGSVDSGEVLRRVEAVTQPAPLHGAGVFHEPYSGPFLRPPSARGIRTRPQLRTDPPFSWPDTIPAAQQRVGTQQAHTYVPQRPWAEEKLVVRPATPGWQSRTQAIRQFPRREPRRSLNTSARTHSGVTGRQLVPPAWMASDACEDRWTAPAAGTHASERQRWQHNAHYLTASFNVKAEASCRIRDTISKWRNLRPKTDQRRD